MDTAQACGVSGLCPTGPRAYLYFSTVQYRSHIDYHHAPSPVNSCRFQGFWHCMCTWQQAQHGSTSRPSIFPLSGSLPLRIIS